MLGLLAPKRQILAIDNDSEKIEICQNCFLCKNNVRFQIANTENCDFTESDTFVLSKHLQTDTLERILGKLNSNGLIITDKVSKELEYFAKKNGLKISEKTQKMVKIYILKRKQ